VLLVGRRGVVPTLLASAVAGTIFVTAGLALLHNATHLATDTATGRLNRGDKPSRSPNSASCETMRLGRSESNNC
jgi:hypothetical protein